MYYIEVAQTVSNKTVFQYHPKLLRTKQLSAFSYDETTKTNEFEVRLMQT